MRSTAALGAAAALAAVLLVPSTSGAVTVGAPLGLSANAGSSCQGLALVGTAPSCTLFGSDSSGAWTSQTPRGSWRITRARVRTGPNVGPMAFTVLRALRSQAGSPPAGIICCTAPAESPAFTPAPNTVNEVAVNLPAVNTVEDIDGEPVEVVDYVGISMLNSASTLPVHRATSAVAGASFTAFIPAIRLGQQALTFGGFPESAVLVNGEFEPAATTTPVPEAVAPVAPPFRVLPGLRLLPGGSRARLGVAAPGAGLLRAFAPVRGRARAGEAPTAAASARRKQAKRGGKRRKPRLLIPAKRRVRQAGKAYITVKLTRLGQRRLRRRGKLTVPVRLVFKPDGGPPTGKVRRVVFRKQAAKRKKCRGKSKRCAKRRRR